MSFPYFTRHLRTSVETPGARNKGFQLDELTGWSATSCFWGMSEFFFPLRGASRIVLPWGSRWTLLLCTSSITKCSPRVNTISSLLSFQWRCMHKYNAQWIPLIILMNVELGWFWAHKKGGENHKCIPQHLSYIKATRLEKKTQQNFMNGVHFLLRACPHTDSHDKAA